MGTEAQPARCRPSNFPLRTVHVQSGSQDPRQRQALTHPPRAPCRPPTGKFPRASGQKSANPPASPGGHVDVGETSLAASVRELEEETGITVAADDLRQVGAFDAPGRDPRGRYVSVAYTATLPAPVQPTAGDDATAARWWPLDALPELAFDHADILAGAAAR
ncbi:NUDIX domain-containing protein [Streptomyces sp. MMS24-I31]|uniref:NUDIX domain-containing protein n=1 Tax=Streptomyces sp. MMS24-I31 TaxID=3351563 RepID=UPI00389688D0